MATPPLLFMLTDQTPTTTTTTHETIKTHIGLLETKPETETRGRKPGKGSTKKKQPQRGMGVAQLERLRLQERWKKITQIPDQVQYQPFPDPIASVPVHYSAGNYHGPMIGGSGLVGLDPGLVIQSHGNNGGFGGFGCVGSGQGFVDPNWIGASRFESTTTVLETSKELSSMPNMQQCVLDRCDACFKKRFNGGNIGFNGGINKYKTIRPINSCDFLGLNNLESNPNFNGEINGFGARVPKSAIYAGHNLNEGVEVVAIHRKENSMGGSIFLEYEFFPGNSGRSTSNEELMEFPTEDSVAVGGEASYITTTAYRANASNSVDLSLKLSC